MAIYCLQFQARGTPHVHALIAVILDAISAEDIHSTDAERVAALKKLIDDTLTARIDKLGDGPDFLPEPHEYDWQPDSSDNPRGTIPEVYENDMRRLMFTADVDFRMDADGNFVSMQTKADYARYQIHNQIHFCCDTCYKYSSRTYGQKQCRFHYPIDEDLISDSTCMIVTSLDRRMRKHVRILPKRNNAWVNTLPTRPLVVYASQGNLDVQYIDNAEGAAQYTMSYVVKADEPDKKVVFTLFNKKIASILAHNEGNITNRQQLRAAGHAAAASQHVGAVQCCYTLLRLPFVIKSRSVMTVNPLPHDQMRKVLVVEKEALEGLGEQDSAFDVGLSSHMGKRNAYSALCEQQLHEYGSCAITYFGMLSQYSLQKYDAKKHSKLNAPPHIRLDDEGKYICMYDTLLLVLCCTILKVYD